MWPPPAGFCRNTLKERAIRNTNSSDLSHLHVQTPAFLARLVMLPASPWPDSRVANQINRRSISFAVHLFHPLNHKAASTEPCFPGWLTAHIVQLSMFKPDMPKGLYHTRILSTPSMINCSCLDPSCSISFSLIFLFCHCLPFLPNVHQTQALSSTTRTRRASSKAYIKADIHQIVLMEYFYKQEPILEHGLGPIMLMCNEPVGET